MLDRLKELHEIQLEKTGDPALETRIAQYEMGYRMQASIPDVTDFSKEPESTYKLYGEDARTPGTFAANCLLARRLVEKEKVCTTLPPGMGSPWALPSGIKNMCKQTDQASASDYGFKQRGLLRIPSWGWRI